MSTGIFIFRDIILWDLSSYERIIFTDIKLHYIEKSSGYPLILLHGNGENSGYFEHQTKFFSDRYRVIAESIPSAQLKIIEGTHFIAHDSPDESNMAAEEFLKQKQLREDHPPGAVVISNVFDQSATP